jgi:hypothetical protein
MKPNPYRIRYLVYDGVRNVVFRSLDISLAVPFRSQVGSAAADAVWDMRMRVSLEVCGAASVVLEHVERDVGRARRVTSRIQMRALSEGGH